MTVTEVFLNLFQFRSEFCFVSYAEYNVQDLSMLEKFRGMGPRKLYMIFSLTDETYALLSSARAPVGVDPRKFFLHFSTCSIYIQHWNYDSIFPGNAFDKRNRFL